MPSVEHWAQHTKEENSVQLKKEQVHGWAALLAAGKPIRFGYCPRERVMTPAVVDAGPEGVSARCGSCGLSNTDFADRDKHYRIGNDLTCR